MVYSPKLVVVTDGKHQTGISFTHGNTIHFESLGFITDRFSNLSLSEEGNDSSAVFVEMAHNGSLSLHTIIKDSIDEGNTTSSGGGCSGFVGVLYSVYHGLSVMAK
jgi:hypothetical protein